MGKHQPAISRRGFVAASGAVALGAGLGATATGCSSGGDAAKGGDAQKEDKWVPTTCNMCFNQCSILAHVVDGKVVELKGNPDSPVGRGHICAKGASGIMQLYDPNRITKPMKRTNPKKGFDQDPGWEEISWDEAYELVNKNISEAIERSGPHAVTGMSMVASQAGSLVRHTALGVIYGNAEGSCSDICGAGVHQLEYLHTGSGNAMPDYKYCNYIVQFGTNAGTATRHGFNMTVEPFSERRKEGLRLVSFDPHMGGSGEQADLWVPILPGTDAAVALAMAYVLVHEENLIDVDFLTNRTNGPALVDLETKRIIRAEGSNKALYMDLSDNAVKPYDECEKPALEGTFEVDGKTCSTGFTLYKEHIKTYTPEYAESISTVPAATIRQVAKEYGEAAHIGETITIDGVTLPYRPVCVDAFSGITRHKHSFLTCWSVFSLNNLVGATNAVGGFIRHAMAGPITILRWPSVLEFGKRTASSKMCRSCLRSRILIIKRFASPTIRRRRWACLSCSLCPRTITLSMLHRLIRTFTTPRRLKWRSATHATRLSGGETTTSRPRFSRATSMSSASISSLTSPRISMT